MNNYNMLMKRTGNCKNVVAPTTEFIHRRLLNRDWVRNFDPEHSNDIG